MEGKISTKRRHQRFPIDQKIAAKIIFDDVEHHLQLLNVSESGMCVEGSARIPAGEILQVQFGEHKIPVTRVWHMPMSHSPISYRIGLKRVQDTDNLVAHSLASGYIVPKSLQ